MIERNISNGEYKTRRSKIMKIIKTGSTYQIYGEDLIVLDKLTDSLILTAQLPLNMQILRKGNIRTGEPRSSIMVKQKLRTS